MKRRLLISSLFLGCLFGCGANAETESVNLPKDTTKIIVAYVRSGGDELPDPTKMTHINYAFGGVNKTFDGVDVENPNKLKKVSALKSVNPELKVMLSIGGWGAGGFSEMASNENNRTKFVEACNQIVEDFDLDGIDLDWEYPTSSAAGITSSPQDRDNFTKLVKELRTSFGNEKLITFASANTAKFYDFKAVEPYLNFVNLMTYDMERPPRGGHHSALYSSKNAVYSVEKSVKDHMDAGLPKDKIVLGVPFYAHANTAKGYNDFESYPLIDSIFKGHKFMWDTVAMVPYVSDKDDDAILCVYDNAKSIDIKCEYIFSNGLRGIMYWVYGADGEKGELRDAVYFGMKNRK